MKSKVVGSTNTTSQQSDVGCRMSEVGSNNANLYLLGFMGAGKTSVGRRLAELLGWTFIDLDLEIEKREGMPISEIFRLRGEARFRVLELQELQRASEARSTVIAIGGGAFCSAENQAIIARSGISVWLDAPIDLLFARCGGDATVRPLFSGISEMAQLLERRRPFYARAQLHLQVGNLGVEDLARRIQAEIQKQP